MATLYYELLRQEDIDVGTDLTTKRNPAGGTLAATQVGVHSFGVGQESVTATWDPGEVAAGGEVSTTVTVPGAALGDFVLRSFSVDLQELTLTADVVSANTVEVVLANLTGAAVDLGSGTLKVLVLASR